MKLAMRISHHALYRPRNDQLTSNQFDSKSDQQEHLLFPCDMPFRSVF